MLFSGVVWVALGGACGAVLRWLLGLALNQLSPIFALGTLAANLLGAFLMGLIVSALHKSLPISPSLQLFIMTGLLGGLTTFSSFTAESFTLLHQNQFFYFFLHLLLHLVGSLLCFSLAWYLFNFFSPRF